MIQATNTKPSIILLGAASGLSPLGVTIAVPILALTATQYQADFGMVQFLISAYLFGLAIAQPFNGFLCDRFGRRPVLLIGFTVFVFASIWAAFASSLEELIALRFVQAVGVSVGTVASRAVVRDTRGAEDSAEAMSYIAASTGFAPVVAPMLGGLLGAMGGTRAVFLASAGFGVAILLWLWVSLPETLERNQERPRLKNWMQNYAILLRSVPFLAYSLIFGFVQGSFFAFLAVGADIFDTRFDIRESEFGLYWGLMAITYVAGAIIGGRLTRSRGTQKVMMAGVALTLAGGLLLEVWLLLAGVTVMGLLIPMAILMSAAGAVSPGALAGAVNSHPEMAGTSAGLSSALGIVVGGMFSVISGFVYKGDFEPVVLLILGSVTLTCLSWLWVYRHKDSFVAPA